VDIQTKRIRIDVLVEMSAMLEKVAELDDRSVSSVFRELTRLIFESLQKGNATIKLTPSWALAWASLDKQAIDEGLQRDSAEIDFSVLATSRTTNSGFEGVYMHSNPARGFNAHGRDPETKKPGKHLGLFSSAAQAAWARYQHYKKHNMPYGKLEEAMEKVRAHPDTKNWGAKPMPERWVRAIAIWNLAMKGTILPDLDKRDRKWETYSPPAERDYGED
jgi:hypothetical protein